MLEYKLQNPADKPADIRLLFGGINGRDTMECTHTCHGNCWLPGHCVYRYKRINAEQKHCPGAHKAVLSDHAPNHLQTQLVPLRRPSNWILHA
jgi:hypothetical protein